MTDVCSTTEFGIGGAWLAEYTLEALGAGVLYFDRQAEIVQWNVVAARLLGVTEELLAGRGIDDACWHATRANGDRLSEYDNPVRLVLDSGESGSSERIAVLNDGRLEWLRITALPIYGPGRQVRGVLASLVPAANDARVADILTAAVQSGRVAFERSIAANVIVDRSGQVVDWNRGLCDLVQRPDVELVGCQFDQICDADLKDLWVEGSPASKGAAWVETRAKDSSGKVIPVVGHFSVVDWPGSGRSVMVQLLDAHQFVRSVPPTVGLEMSACAHIKLAMLTMTTDGVVVELNQTAAELFDRPVSEMVREQIVEHVSFFPDPLPLRELSEQLRSIIPSWFGLCSVRQADGSVVLKDWYMSRVADGRPLVLVQLAEVSIESLEGIADGGLSS
ncbi:MAG: PAS domain S-box-containing protein [Gammaproteobacteria bacterium]|jgi:PAS domain S-box-containing protein